jgi:hypothetical protein
VSINICNYNDKALALYTVIILFVLVAEYVNSAVSNSNSQTVIKDTRW